MVVVPQPCKARYYFRARPDRPKPMIVSRFIEPNGARSSCVQADEFPCPDSFASQFHRRRAPKRDAHTRLAVSDAHRVIQACGSCVQADEFPCPDSFASQFHRLRTPKRDAHTRLAVSDAHRVIQACGSLIGWGNASAFGSQSLVILCCVATVQGSPSCCVVVCPDLAVVSIRRALLQCASSCSVGGVDMRRISFLGRARRVTLHRSVGRTYAHADCPREQLS
mmetsp:Transcript_31492/g.100326  ORF Transcript_31492/g.100326 Transcript_31492/m.100326 type:complete len:223 (+) Transcript_31492:358-1026(+)